MSAIEFERYAQEQLSQKPMTGMNSFSRVSAALKQGMGFGRELTLDCLKSLQPWWLRLGPKAVRASLQAADEISVGRKK